MRQLDVFQTYFDNDGNPLLGRVRFCDSSGTAANVYQRTVTSGTESYTSLGSTLYTNNAGRLKYNVFLGDIDYTIYFDKYTGTASMETDDEEDIWDNIGSTVNKYNTVGISVATAALQAVNSISDLRTTDPDGVTTRSAVKEVTLLGYNAPCDKEPVVYYWDATSTEDDDDGSVIQAYVSGQAVATGRWKLKITDGTVNTRDFGIIPTATVTASITNRTKFGKAATFANANGFTLFACEAGCYDISGLTVGCKLSMGANAILSAVTGYTATVSNADETVYAASNTANSMTGTITIKGDILKMSQNGNWQDSTLADKIVLQPSLRLVLDRAYPASLTLTYSDLDILFTTLQTCKLDLTYCNIHSANYITCADDSKFRRCHIRENYFLEFTPSEIGTFCENCYSDPADWTLLVSYNTFITSQGQPLTTNALVATSANFSGAVSVTGNNTVGGTTETAALVVTGTEQVATLSAVETSTDKLLINKKFVQLPKTSLDANCTFLITSSNVDMTILTTLDQGTRITVYNEDGTNPIEIMYRYGLSEWNLAPRTSKEFILVGQGGQGANFAPIG